MEIHDLIPSEGEWLWQDIQKSSIMRVGGVCDTSQTFVLVDNPDSHIVFSSKPRKKEGDLDM
jgi:hypothetical protein